MKAVARRAESVGVRPRSSGAANSSSAKLRDIKVSPRVESFGAPEMDLYATWCGRALALSHARSGTSATLSGYMGKGDAFDEAIAAFSIAYADQNEKDHDALERAVRKSKVKAVFEEAA